MGPNDGHFDDVLSPGFSWAYFGHTVPDAGRPGVERWNLGRPTNAVIDIGDINPMNPAVTAPTARPPMFGGAQAFFAGECPWPP